MERRKAFVLGGGAIAVIAGLWVVFGGDGQEPTVQARAATTDRAAGERADTLANTQVADVAPPGLDSARPTDCLIEPSQVVRVNSGVEGIIQSIYVERGDNVRRGQVVAQLRDDIDRAAAAAAQARASNSHNVQAADSRASYLESVRQRNESVSQYLSRDQVEEAQSNARAAREERSSAAEDQRVARLEYNHSTRIMAEKTVRSPVNGVVVERAMSPGEYRGPDSTHILTIAQVDPLNVEVFAPIAQLDAVKLGDEVTIIPEEPVGGKYIARVKVVDRVFDAASGTFGMRLELPNPGNKLPAGLRCRIEFNSAARPS
jgi:RND family efflux transporter MFP subunit